MKKNYLFILMVLFMGLFLAACGNEETSKSETNQENGNKVSQGVTDKEILIGSTGPQSGPLADIDQVRKGLQSYFNYINDNGGVNERKIKLIAYDDQYQPNKTVTAVQRLIGEDKVFALAAPVGTASMQAVLPTLKEVGIPVSGLLSSSNDFVIPPIKNIFIGQTNIAVDAKLSLDYLITKLGAKKIAVAYQNDDLGKAGLAAMQDVIDKYDGVSIVEEVGFLATDQDLSALGQQLVKAEPDGIMILTASVISASSLRQELHKLNKIDIPYLVSGGAGSNKSAFDLAGKEVWEGIYTSSAMTPLELLDHPEVEIFKEQVTKDNGEKALNPYSQLGWIQGQILVEGLKRAGDDLTWENFIDQMNTITDWEGSFYPKVTFSPESHFGNTSILFFQAKDGELELVSDVITFDPITGEVSKE